MKRIATFFLAVVITVTSTRAGDGDDALRGGLMGAAFGALLGEIDSGIDSEVSIPLFAGLGALAGYTWDREWDHYDGDYRYYRRYGRRYGRYGYRHGVSWPYAPLPLRYSPYPTRIVSVPRKEAGKAKASSPAPNRHPGVSLVTVPITLKNGMQIDVRILKLGGERYVGPKGEAYDSLPTAEVLSQRYAQ
jgi:hypothetical protein